MWNAVNVGITALLHQQGRRVILVFTDGVDSPMNFSNNNSSLKDVMRRAEEEDVMVYAAGQRRGVVVGRAAPRVIAPRVVGVAPLRFYRPYYFFRPRVSLGFGL